MEFLNGGDLRYHLEWCGSFDHDTSRYVCAVVQISLFKGCHFLLLFFYFILFCFIFNLILLGSMPLKFLPDSSFCTRMESFTGAVNSFLFTVEWKPNQTQPPFPPPNKVHLAVQIVFCLVLCSSIGVAVTLHLLVYAGMWSHPTSFWTTEAIADWPTLACARTTWQPARWPLLCVERRNTWLPRYIFYWLVFRW